MLFGGWGALSPAQGQTCAPPNWEARYYNSVDLSGSVVYSDCTPLLDFNWGLDAPAPGINPDNFSVRWTSTQSFAAPGTYLFTAQVDDGVRLYINGSPLIDALNPSEGPTTLSARHTIQNPGQTAFITLEMANWSGPAQVRLTWSLASGGASPPSATTTANNANDAAPTTDTGTALSNNAVVGEPWAIEYFNSPDLSGEVVATGSAPADGIAVIPGLDAPATGVNADGWSARWTRAVDFPAGVYTFTLRADDRARVLINGIEVLNQAAFAQGQSFTVAVEIPAGRHTIVVEHADDIQAANLFLTWDPPIGTNFFPDGCNSILAGANGSAPPCPERAAPTAAAAMPVTVRAGPLRFRPQPSTTATPLRTISRGEQYTALGRSADNVWVQLRVDGVVGWSMTEFLTLSGQITSLPITDGSAPPPVADPADPAITLQDPEGVLFVGPDGDVRVGPALEGDPTEISLPQSAFIARANANLRIRSEPRPSAQRVGDVPWGETVAVLGRTADNEWVLIAYEGLQGWSAAPWYDFEQGTLAEVPVVP